MSTHKFEILCNIVHLLSLQIRYDNVYIVAAVIMHAP